MTSRTPLSAIDPVTEDDLAALAAVQAEPCVSVFMPTHRHGPETVQNAKRLGQLLDRAAELGATDDVLAPLRALVGDDEFWQQQSAGLALFSAPGFFRRHRLSVEAAEEVRIGEVFHLRPLVPVASGERFRLLALSQNEVRLFEAGRFSIEELDLAGVPRSLSEALAFEDSEKQLQVRSAGGEGMFHGHGAGEELDKAEVERYLRALDHALRERFGVTSTPLVLATVGYYQPIFASVSTAHSEVVVEVVEGNPERRSAEELHAEAWPIIDRWSAPAREAELRRLRDVVGTGMAAADLSTVVLAATAGRVETLFVAPGPPVFGAVDRETATVRVADTTDAAGGPLRSDLVDIAVVETVRHAGTLRHAEPGSLPDGAALAALMRY